MVIKISVRAEMKATDSKWVRWREKKRVERRERERELNKFLKRKKSKKMTRVFKRILVKWKKRGLFPKSLFSIQKESITKGR